MEKDITLLILAGGMGSRFGGLKQIEEVGPTKEFIIDYSIHDAINAGINKVVFLIKPENFEIFKETIGSRVEPHVKVEYCFQTNENLSEIKLPSNREKPYGTAHAILCCKDKIKNDFIMINADDFYGKDAYIKGCNFLREISNTDKHEYGMVSYKVKKTMTDYGSVKRGVCFADNNKLTTIIESKVEEVNGKIIASPLNGEDEFTVEDDTLVAMNFFMFRPSIFEIIEQKLPKYFEKNKNNLDDFEFLIPDVLEDSIKEKTVNVSVVPTDAVWHGITYKEDLASVKGAIEELIVNGEYNSPLWENKQCVKIKCRK